MNKIHLSLVIMAVSIVFTCGCSRGTDTGPSAQAGSISVPGAGSGVAIRVKYFDTTSGSPVLETISVHHYNENGLIIKGDHLNADGTLSWYDKYDYNASLQNTIYSSYNGTGALMYRVAHEYNPAGQLVKTTQYDSTGNVENYDIYENGQLINADFEYNSINAMLDYGTTESFSSNGETNGVDVVDFSSAYTYYPSGALQNYSLCAGTMNGRRETSNYDGSGALTGSAVYEYSGLRSSRITSYDNTGAMTGFTVYDYDAAGWLLKYSFYDKNGKLTGYYLNYF